MSHLRQYTYYLLVTTFGILLLELFRVFWVGRFALVYLLWNIFLAWVPFVASFYFEYKTRFVRITSWIIWVLFFANAPYIVTDFIHLKSLTTNLPYLDIALIFLSAWLGVLLGVLSLNNVYSRLRKKISRASVVLVFAILYILTTFAIYLGRFERWNSWDFIIQPHHIVSDVVFTIMALPENPQPLFVSALISFVMFVCFITMRGILKVGKGE